MAGCKKSPVRLVHAWIFPGYLPSPVTLEDLALLFQTFLQCGAPIITFKGSQLPTWCALINFTGPFHHQMFSMLYHYHCRSRPCLLNTLVKMYIFFVWEKFLYIRFIGFYLSKPFSQPDLCGSVGWVSSRKVKGLRLNSRSGHVPGLLVLSRLGHVWKSTDQCFTSSLSSTLLFCLKTNKIF